MALCGWWCFKMTKMSLRTEDVCRLVRTYDTLQQSFSTGFSTDAIYRINIDTFRRHAHGSKVCFVPMLCWFRVPLITVTHNVTEVDKVNVLFLHTSLNQC